MENHKKNIHRQQNKNQEKSFNVNLYVGLGLILIVIIMFNIFQASSFSRAFDQKLVKTKEDARPAKIGLVLIDNKACGDCFSISPIIDNLKQSNVEIINEKNLEFDSAEGQEMIKKYNIEKIPTIILSGEIDKLSFRELEKRDDILVFTQLNPPYTDAKTGQVIGEVSAVTLKDSSCNQCTDMKLILGLLKDSGIKIVSEKEFESSSDEGKRLIGEYSLKILPALILSKDLGAYDLEPVRNWESAGSIENDGSYVARVALPPFVNLTSNKIQGLVDIIYLEDASCQECYNAEELHKPILKSMGIFIDKEEKIDVMSAKGKLMVDKYAIEKVPTLILKGDINTYPGLADAWSKIGTVEPDGTYIFRSVEFAGLPYKDLAGGKIIQAAT